MKSFLMNNKKIISAFLISAIAVSTLAGCAGKTPAPAPAAQPAATPAPAAAQPAATPAPAAQPAAQPAGTIKIGLLTSLSGALQDYGTQMQEGFMLGLEYATQGTMMVAGKKIEVIAEDTTTVPDVARERCIKLLDEDEVDIVVGPASSSDAAAVLDLFQEFDKVLVVDPAAGDIITGANFNDHVFRTGRASSMDAIAMAEIILGNKPDAKIAAIAPDSTFGHTMIDPFVKAVEKRGSKVVQTEFCPADTTDFSPYILRIKNSAPDYVYVVWAGANNPWAQIMEFNLQQYGINITTGAPEIAALKAMNDLVGMTGFCVYHWTLPQNEMNDWLVAKLKEKGKVPDLFTPGGMAAAMAVVTALEKTNGDADAAKLIATMEGMHFDTPTGDRYFRKEDHQAIQVLYEMQLEKVDGLDYPQPKLIKVLDAEALKPDITAPGR